jgi:uncharacterized protein YkwD
MSDDFWEDVLEEVEDEAESPWPRAISVAFVIVMSLGGAFVLGRCSAPDGSGSSASQSSAVTSSEFSSVTQFTTTTVNGTVGTTPSIPVVSTSENRLDRGSIFSPPDGTPTRMLTRVNEERANEGLSPLEWCPSLARSALNHSRDMAARQYFEHDSPDGEEVADRAESEGYDYSFVGENIAVGQRSVAEVMDAWMDSPGHRRNILLAEYEHFGLGLYRGEYQGQEALYWTQNFGSGGMCD